MTWTTPKTWATGELVTAAMMNTHVRDNEDALKGSLVGDGEASLIHRHASGTLGARPAAGNAGKLYVVTTAGVEELFLDDGGEWLQVPLMADGTDAKGDLIAHNGSRHARFPIGSDWDTPFADSAQSIGLRWRAPILNRNLSTVAITNTTDESELYSYTIPANSVGVNGGARLVAAGTFFANSGTTYRTLRVKLGGTTILESLYAWPAVATYSGHWAIDVSFMCNNNLAIQKWVARLKENRLSATDTWPTGAATVEGVGYAASTKDLSADQALVFTVQWAASSTNLIWTKQIAWIERLPG